MKNIYPNEIAAAMMTMSEVTSINHIFDDSLSVRGGGLIKYVLEIGARLFLAWHDEDSDVMVVSPIELWDLENLRDALDDPLSILSFRAIDIAQMNYLY